MLAQLSPRGAGIFVNFHGQSRNRTLVAIWDREVAWPSPSRSRVPFSRPLREVGLFASAGRFNVTIPSPADLASVVAQIEFLRALCGLSSRTQRLKAFVFSPNNKSLLTAKSAKESRKVREEIQTELLPRFPLIPVSRRYLVTIKSFPWLTFIPFVPSATT